MTHTREKTMHDSLSLELILDAAERQMTDLDNPGFCVKCGTEYDDCEPDMRNRKCEECGKNQVFGAAELVMMFA